MRWRQIRVVRQVTPQSLSDHRFEQYVRLFNERRFFEAHEVLEAVWLTAPPDEKQALQGLVQIAVALEHTARGNLAGARKVLSRASRRLAEAGGTFGPLNLQELLQLAAGYIEGRLADPPRLSHPR